MMGRDRMRVRCRDRTPRAVWHYIVRRVQRAQSAISSRSDHGPDPAQMVQHNESSAMPVPGGASHRRPPMPATSASPLSFARRLSFAVCRSSPVEAEFAAAAGTGAAEDGAGGKDCETLLAPVRLARCLGRRGWQGLRLTSAEKQWRAVVMCRISLRYANGIAGLRARCGSKLADNCIAWWGMDSTAVLRSVCGGHCGTVLQEWMGGGKSLMGVAVGTRHGDWVAQIAGERRWESCRLGGCRSWRLPCWWWR